MKKSIMYATVLGLTLAISSGATYAISKMAPIDIQNNTLAVAESELGPKNINNFSSKNESVFVITDKSGKKTKTFVNNNLETSNNSLPFDIQIAYFLDGKEISADEISGKTGHVKIVYKYSPVKTYQDKYVPFLMVAGFSLDQARFKNVKLDNAKIVSESDNLVIAGYALVGLSENLGVDFIADSFSIEADVEDFSLGTVYTLATNELIAELDVSKLNTLDEITSQLNLLSASFEQILAGSLEFTNGLNAALSGSKKLQTGTGELWAGAKKLADGATSVDAGANELADGATRLSDGLNAVVNVNNQIMAKVLPITSEIDAKIETLNDYVAEIAEKNPKLADRLAQVLEQLSGKYNQAYSAVMEYTGGIEALANGAGALKDGASALANGTGELKAGAEMLASGAGELKAGSDTLTSGLEQLVGGSYTLNNGLNMFKTQGINKLVNFANQDLQSFRYNLKKSVDAAKSYHYYSNPNANSVKFVLKTPSI